MKKIRTAVFGLAHPHLSTLVGTVNKCSEDFELIGFADLPTHDPNYYELFKKQLNERYCMREYSDWRDLAAQKPDFAIVTTDNASRGEICSQLLEMGIHVLDEKPMAMHFEDAARMYRIAKEKGVHMLTNWPIAWFPAFRLAKKLLDEGRIGKLMRVTYRSPATWGPFSYSSDGSLPPEETLLSSWWYQAERGGGSILDYACYGTLLSTWMFGKQAERVSSIAKNFCVQFSDVEDFSAMILDFGDGVGLLEGSWSTYNCGEVPSGPVLHGTEGTIVCDRHSATLKLYTGKSHQPIPPTEVFEEGKDRQEELLGPHLARVLLGKEEPDAILSPELNLAVVAALDAGARSAHTGQTLETERLTNK